MTYVTVVCSRLFPQSYRVFNSENAEKTILGNHNHFKLNREDEAVNPEGQVHTHSISGLSFDKFLFCI